MHWGHSHKPDLSSILIPVVRRKNSTGLKWRIRGFQWEREGNSSSACLVQHSPYGKAGVAQGERGLIAVLVAHSDEPPLRTGEHASAGFPFRERALLFDRFDELRVFLALFKDQALLAPKAFVLLF